MLPSRRFRIAVLAVAVLALGGVATMLRWQAPDPLTVSLAPATTCVRGCPGIAASLIVDSGPRAAAAPAWPGAASETVFFDEHERIVRIEADTNLDGRTDQWRYHEGSDLPVRIELDANFDGRPDERRFYDGSKTPVRVERDTDFDGVPDVTQERPSAP